MKLIRIVLPFLFVRNWSSGEWELSRSRIILFGLGLGLLFIAFGILLLLQAPVKYN